MHIGPNRRGHLICVAEVGAADGRLPLGDARLRTPNGVNYPMLTPNLKGFEAAVAEGAKKDVRTDRAVALLKELRGQ